MSQVLYLWGGWAWYHRFLAAVTWGVGALLLLLVEPIRELIAQPGAANVALLGLIALLVAGWGAWAWVTWRRGRSRATRIELLPGGTTLRVRDLNFGIRQIPLGELGEVRLEQMRVDAGTDGDASISFDPRLIVAVRGGPPIVLDLQARFIDRPALESILRSPVPQFE